MKPLCRITADGQSVDFRGLLVSVEIKDGDGEESDTLTLTLDNRGGQIQKPRRGVKLNVSLGYAEGRMIDKGVFTVNEVSDAWPMRILQVHACASDFTTESPIKQPKTRSWPQVSLGDLVTTVAKESNLEPAVSPDLAALIISHYDQTESDIQMLSTLAYERGAICKTAGNKLLFVRQGEATSASGKPLESKIIVPAAGTTVSVSYKDRSDCTGVRAFWQQIETATLRSVLAGDDQGPVYELAQPYPDEATAGSAAKAKLKELGRGTAEVRIAMPGDPMIFAETPLLLRGFDADVDGDWVVKEITHSLGDGGYSCSLTAVPPGQEIA